MQAIQREGGSAQILDEISSMIDKAQALYVAPFRSCVLPEIAEGDRHSVSLSFDNSIIALAVHGLPQEKLDHLLTSALGVCGQIILGVENEDYELHQMPSGTRSSQSPPEASQHVIYRTFYRESQDVLPDGNLGEDLLELPRSVDTTRGLLFQLLARLWRTGLGRNRTQKILAGVLHNLMARFVEWAYAGTYDGEIDVVSHLKFWVENVFARFVVQVLNILRDTEPNSADSVGSSVDLSDMRKWQEMAISRLGVLRVGELFDIVVDWDNTRNGIRDLKHYTTNPATRAYLTSRFIGALTARLLHPGASTIEILQLYISIIRAFRELDPRGVLLDRVARPIRRYLREREDTVKVIVGGLLSDVPEDDTEPSNPEVLSELAIELNEQTIATHADDEGELDWNNMEWVPDPVDAAPDYKKSKNSDVIGSLISLLESKEVFVREFQTNLADRLLQPGKDFDQETKVIEHLKLRFGDQALQACDVMLRDVTDSRRLDNTIRQDQHLDIQDDKTPSTATDPSSLALHAKILSRLFWPPLPDQPFTVPEPISALQHRYQAGFSAVKQSRKLTWLNHLGHVTVELDLEDRVVTEEVLPWQATVIYAFQSSSDSSLSTTGPAKTPISKTVDELASTLNMSAALVRSACIFWLAKRILASPSRDVYTVLERLPTSDSTAGGDATATGAAAATIGDHHHQQQPPTTTTTAPASHTPSASAEAEAAASAALAQAQSEAHLDRLSTYRPFIIGMLTNQGSLPLPRIAMMLGMVVPGGFPYRNEELKEFLGRLVSEGTVEVGGGGVYRMRRE